MYAKPVLALGFCACTLAAQTTLFPFRLTRTLEDIYNYVPARFTRIGSADSLAIDRDGGLYIADWGMIRKIGPDGIIVPLRTPTPNQLGQGYHALTLDQNGNLFFYDNAAGTVMRLAPDGGLTQWLPRQAVPNGTLLAMAAGSGGELYILQYGRVLKVLNDASHTVTNLAGNGTLGYSGDGGPATEAMIFAQGIAAAADGTVYLADTGNDRIRAIDPSGIIRTVAGVSRPQTVLPTGRGTLYVGGIFPPAIYEVNESAHTVNLIAGTLEGGQSFLLPSWGEGGPASAARLAGPRAMALGRDGSLYFLDSDTLARIRRIAPDGILTTFAGCACSPDAVPVQWLTVNQAFGVIRDSAGNLYFSDQATHQVRRVGVDGIATVIAGNGETGFTGDGGPATSARLSRPAGLAIDAAGNLYIADEQNHRLRRVSPSGVITTATGNGSGQDIGAPDGVAVDAAGNLYVSDTAGHRVRRVQTDGSLVTVAGTGTAGSAGDGGPAIAAQLENPRGLAIDTDGGLLISDSSGHRVRKVMPDGTIRTAAALDPYGTPYAAVPDNQGGIIVADYGLYRVIRVDSAGNIQTLAGLPTIGPPTGVAVAPDGTICVTGLGLAALRPVNAEPLPPVPSITSSGIDNAAGQIGGTAAPGEIVAIYGTRLGPKTGAVASPSSGSIAPVLAGVRVLFDGTPAPVLYASDTQINAVVPSGVTGDSVAVQTEFNGVVSNAEKVPLLTAAPALFRTGTSTSAINQDGTVNDFAHPAHRGEVISLFGTGGGVMVPTPPDGEITSTSLSRIVAPIRAQIGGADADVQYAGSAPGFVAGAMQLNLLIPAGAQSGDVAIQIAGHTAAGSISLQ